MPRTCLLPLLGFIVAVLACAEDRDSDAGFQCPCIPEQTIGDPMLPSCGELLCPQIIGADDGPSNTIEFDNPEAIDCALAALRDRTPGLLRWDLQYVGGQFEDIGYLLIEADATLYTREWGFQDLAFIAEDAVTGPARDSAEFEACLAEPEPSARFECVRLALASTEATCSPGWHEDVI